ncbi:LOW QUALITY PROTEIN: hypothetical protein Cgig2_022530 [Carnegiea gigantea]|uniref:Cwf19-like C-terminal domain-containing protein n=1 Tax=Carnegiea gigantea TaxID=171969 RepID=A0A9Q1JNP6_9CARY|nr:LOW QUALITY PROTEIN: hypothetical protein Cgig2_022530 [Carnegiea gigantea]
MEDGAETDAGSGAGEDVVGVDGVAGGDRWKGMENDTNIRLAQRIMKKRQYTMSTQADDEHNCDGAPTEKNKGKGTHLNNELDASQNLVKRPKRPKHLVVAIANFTNWMLHKILECMLESEKSLMFQGFLQRGADDEYGCHRAPTKTSKRKGAQLNELDTCEKLAKCIEESCVFCFEKPTKPKHLVVAIANFAYLMLPQYQPIAPGNYCIHEPGTRMVDDEVWEEIRNFKKCLILMFAKQAKEVLFWKQ